MGRVKGFDGIRALAVLMVIMSHAVIWPRIGVENQKIIDVFSPSVGVSIFFALSGFLITSLLIHEKQEKGGINVFNFIVRRSLRIFPLYFLAVFLILFMDSIGAARINNCIYLYAFTYTLNFVPQECNFSSFSHFWSLAVEQHFYLVWPFVFLLGRYVSLAVAVLFAAACLYFSTSLYSSGDVYYLDRWTFPAALPIAFGCIAAFIAQWRIVKHFLGNPSNSAIVLVAILTGLLSPAFYKSDLVWMISVSLLLLYVFHNQDSLLVRMLEVKPLVVLGVISYGLYVWQGVLTGNGPYRENSLPFPPEMDAGLWMTFIAAPLSYILFERPLLRLKSRFK